MIRSAELADVAETAALATAFYRAEGFSTPRKVLGRNLRHLLELSSARVAVATEIDLIGFAVTTMGFGLEDGAIAELQELYVDPEHRGRGVGRALVDDAVAWAQARGASAVDVVIAPNGRDVSSLHAYYDGFGFNDDGRRLRTRRIGPST